MPCDELMGRSSMMPHGDSVQQARRPPCHPLQHRMVQWQFNFELVLQVGFQCPVLTRPRTNCLFHTSVSFRLFDWDINGDGRIFSRSCNGSAKLMELSRPVALETYLDLAVAQLINNVLHEFNYPWLGGLASH